MHEPSPLDAIRQGTAPIDDARKAIADALQEVTPKIAQRIYSTLRAWVWKALDQRRRDDELRQWFEIIKRTEAFLAREHGDVSTKLRVLHELLYESISVAEVKSLDEVLRLKHVRDTLFLLYQSPSGRMDRMTIRAELGLGQSNLTRVLNAMLGAGIIERSSFGKEALLQLSHDGLQLAQVELGKEDTSQLLSIVSTGSDLLPVMGRVLVNAHHMRLGAHPPPKWTGSKSAEYLGLFGDDGPGRNALKEGTVIMAGQVLGGALAGGLFAPGTGFVKDPEWNRASRAARAGHVASGLALEDEDAR